jgi:hypothetical protein
MTGRPTFLETLVSLLGTASSAKARHRRTVELTDLLRELRFRLDTPKSQQVASQRSVLAELYTKVSVTIFAPPALSRLVTRQVEFDSSNVALLYV